MNYSPTWQKCGSNTKWIEGHREEGRSVVGLRPVAHDCQIGDETKERTNISPMFPELLHVRQVVIAAVEY
jgi:hypothetical protein